MKRIVKSDRKSESSELNMAPLIDMIFILLIFFLVTASFVKQSGVTVIKSIAETAEKKEKTNLILGITRENKIYIEGREIDIRDVQGQMERFLLENPDGYVVISPARPTGPIRGPSRPLHCRRRRPCRAWSERSANHAE